MGRSDVSSFRGSVGNIPGLGERMCTERQSTVTRSRISVVIPYYNAAEWISQSVGSVLAQTVLPDEVLILDDGSPTVLSVSEFHWPSWVRYIRREENRGVGATRAEATALAQGDIICYLDADDWWDARYLEKMADAIQRDSAAIGWFASISVVTPTATSTPHRGKPTSLAIAQMISGTEWIPSSIVVRKSSVVACGNWSIRRDVMDDWEFGIRLLAGGGYIAFVPEAVVFWRRFDHGNLSSAHWRMAMKHARTAILHRKVIEATAGKGATRRLVAQGLLQRSYKAHGVRRIIFRCISWLIPR